jgi:hypothetical protein
MDLTVTAAILGFALLGFAFATWRARQPAQPLKVRMVNYHIVQMFCIVVVIVMAAHLIRL